MHNITKRGKINGQSKSTGHLRKLMQKDRHQLCFIKQDALKKPNTRTQLDIVGIFYTNNQT